MTFAKGTTANSLHDPNISSHSERELEGKLHKARRGGLNHGSGSSAFITPIEKPVVATNHDGAEAALGRIVVYFQLAVFRVTQQCFPVVGQGVIDGITDRTFRYPGPYSRMRIRSTSTTSNFPR